MQLFHVFQPDNVLGFGFGFFSVQLYFYNTLKYFGKHLMWCGSDQKYLLFISMALFISMCCYSVWQSAADIFASVLGHSMNENHGINIVSCHSRQKSL